MNIRARLLKNNRVSATSADGVWTLTVRVTDREVPYGTTTEEWVARRLCRAMWPTGDFTLAYVDETDTSTEWYGHRI